MQYIEAVKDMEYDRNKFREYATLIIMFVFMGIFLDHFLTAYMLLSYPLRVHESNPIVIPFLETYGIRNGLLIADFIMMLPTVTGAFILARWTGLMVFAFIKSGVVAINIYNMFLVIL